jgi:hypothetical protein
VLAALLVASLAWAGHIVATADGLLLNNYPFLSPDSYDWIVEGAYLARMLGGERPERPLPRGRSPVFVGVMALDALLGQRGIVFAVVSAAAIFATGALLVGHIGSFRYQTAAAVAFLAVTFLAQVNFLLPFVLADSLCVALSIAAFRAMLRAGEGGGGRGGAATAAALTALAGLTQPFGVLAPIVASAVIWMKATFRGDGAVLWRLPCIVAVAGGLVLAGRGLWFSYLPHEHTHRNFYLLRLTTDMIPFYLGAWSYAFLPLLPLALAAGRRRVLRNMVTDTMTVAAWVFALAFMVLCQLFDWPSIRFTSFFWPVLVLALFRTVGARDRVRGHRAADLAVQAAAILAVVQMLLLTPAIANRPSLGSVVIQPGRSWLILFVQARPLDRMDLAARCGDRATLCPASRPLAGGSRYQQMNAAFYEWLMLGRSRPPG